MFKIAPCTTSQSVNAPDLNQQEIATFHQALDKTVMELGLSEENSNDERWAKLAQLTTPSVLSNIYAKKAEIVQLFGLVQSGEQAQRPNMDQLIQMAQIDPAVQGMNFEEAISLLVQRSSSQFSFTSREREKDCGRVEKKLAERVANLGKYPPRYFTVINDYLAFSIPCANLGDFAKAVGHVKSITEKQGGCIGIRNEPGKSNWQSFNDEGKYLDIVQFTHVYLPQVGIVEFQVEHPFARYTFTRDSELRQHPELKSDKPKLWADGFYKMVRQYILDKANGEFKDQEEIRAKRHQEIFEKASAIHQPYGDGKIPEDLLEILNKL